MSAAVPPGNNWKLQNNYKFNKCGEGKKSSEAISKDPILLRQSREKKNMDSVQNLSKQKARNLVYIRES